MEKMPIATYKSCHSFRKSTATNILRYVLPILKVVIITCNVNVKPAKIHKLESNEKIYQ